MLIGEADLDSDQCGTSPVSLTMICSSPVYRPLHLYRSTALWLRAIYIPAYTNTMFLPERGK